MPGKDEKKQQEQQQQQQEQQQQQQEQEQEREQKRQQGFNDFYFSKMELADLHIKESRRRMTDLNDPEANKVLKNNSLKEIAKAMAYAQIAMKYGQGPEPDDDTEEKADKEVDTEAERIFNSPKFQAPFMGMKNSEILNMVSDPKERRPFGVEIPYEKFLKRLQEREKTRAAEMKENAAKIEQQRRLGGLVTELEHSTQKSIFGKIKSIFVGNSQLYENALKAMRELANGTAKDRAAAQGAIEDYIVNRGNKVRDHQYGRDRFDAFMKGLGEISTPEQFMRTVTKVNGERERNGEPTINGADYLQALPEKKQAVEKLAQQAERGKQEYIENRIQFELRQEAKAALTPEQKHQRFVKEEEQRIKNDFDGRHIAKTFTNGEQTVQINPLENNQIYLDRLRKLDIEKSRIYGSKEDKLYQSIQRRINEHPNFRLAAQQIIQERQKADEQKLIEQGKKDPKVNYGFSIPETPISEMSKESVDMLRQHVQELQTLDRKKNPNLDIKEVKVEVPQPKVEKQAGGGIGLGG